MGIKLWRYLPALAMLQLRFICGIADESSQINKMEIPFEYLNISHLPYWRENPPLLETVTFYLLGWTNTHTEPALPPWITDMRVCLCFYGEHWELDRSRGPKPGVHQAVYDTVDIFIDSVIKHACSCKSEVTLMGSEQHNMQTHQSTANMTDFCWLLYRLLRCPTCCAAAEDLGEVTERDKFLSLASTLLGCKLSLAGLGLLTEHCVQLGWASSTNTPLL